MRDHLYNLIRASYSQAEAERYFAFDSARANLKNVASIGSEVLVQLSPMASACAPMTAVWVTLIQKRLGVPAYCVAGDLIVEGRIIFGGMSDTELATAFDKSNSSLDGHCWLGFGEYVGDLSVFRTAYLPQGPKTLLKVVLEKFGPGKGLLLCTGQDAANAGLKYVPKYVLTQAQLNGLLGGAYETFAPRKPA